MRKPSILGWLFLALTLVARTGAAADLTPVEKHWLEGIWPVVTYAKENGLPLDLVIQPQPAAGEAPLAMAFIDGRCKLVLTMRGNDAAQAVLDRIPDGLLGPALELMAAHELGHCRRHLDGAWLRTPSGFAPTAPPGLAIDLRATYLEMQAQRREEAYADLVGLAWGERHHADRYAALQAWLVGERSADLIDGSPHDTLAWIRSAADHRSLGGRTIFDAADAVWNAELDAH
jgi:hypothetical protein